MNAETFLEQFETFAEAPSGVEALREMILQLAVQGKLLPQDSNDEPATALRREMESARQQLIARGEIRAGDTFDAVTQEDAPYQLPCNWGWARVGEVMHLINGKAFKPTDWLTSGLPIVRIQNLNNPDAPFNYSSDDVDDKVRLTTGDFLISWSGTPGTSFGAFIWDRGPAVLNQHIFRAILFGNAYTKPFLRIAVNARLDEMIAQAHGGVGLQHITKGKLERLSLPLPPLAEQKRIVAKVDQLLALCDELAARQEARRVARAQLVGATLDRLVSTRSAADLPPHVNRLQTHFDHLFDTPTTIPQLRQTILQLAVQGQLVPQDPNDEPASSLCEKIAEHKASLESVGTFKARESARPIADGEYLYSIPASWKWMRASDISYPISSGSTPSKEIFQSSPDGGVPYLKVYNIRDQRIDFDYCPQFISREYHQTKMRRSILTPGMVVLNIVGPPLGKTAIVPDTFPEWNCNQAIAFFRLLPGILPEYVHTYFRAGTFLRNIELIGTAGQDNISVTKCQNIVIPLPPLEEQKRIVAKVTELLSLCDTLEAQLQTAESASSQLLSAAVHHLLCSSQDT